MDPVTIRQATLQDLPTLLAFEQGVVATERPFDETLKPGSIHYYDLGAMIQRDDVYVAVAVADNEIVGSGYARVEEAKPYLNHPFHCYLGFMYVRPEYRGKGINAKIIEVLKAWSLSKGITELRLDVYHQNEAAIRAYEKVGFSKLLVNMRMGLDDNA